MYYKNREVEQSLKKVKVKKIENKNPSNTFQVKA